MNSPYDHDESLNETSFVIPDDMDEEKEVHTIDEIFTDIKAKLERFFEEKYLRSVNFTLEFVEDNNWYGFNSTTYIIKEKE